MTVRRDTPAAPLPPSGTAGPVTPEGQFALHVCSGERDLLWHYRLGQLALVCCPQGTPDRTRRLKALAAGYPRCSLSLLYKVMKFALQYKTAKARKLRRDGLRWDQLANLLSIAPVKRARHHQGSESAPVQPRAAPLEGRPV